MTLWNVNNYIATLKATRRKSSRENICRVMKVVYWYVFTRWSLIVWVLQQLSKQSFTTVIRSSIVDHSILINDYWTKSHRVLDKLCRLFDERITITVLKYVFWGHDYDYPWHWFYNITKSMSEEYRQYYLCTLTIMYFEVTRIAQRGPWLIGRDPGVTICRNSYELIGLKFGRPILLFSYLRPLIRPTVFVTYVLAPVFGTENVMADIVRNW